VATLSVLWATRPHNLALYHESGYEYILIEDYGEAASSMEIFVLPEEAGVYHLRTSRGMAIAEARVHAGKLSESFFPTHGYPAGAVREWPSALRRKPLRRSDAGSQVRDMKEMLRALGYDIDKVDRRFSEPAYLALMRFQRASGLYATGVLDYGTLHMLEAPPPQAACFSTAEAEAPLPRTASALVAFLRTKVGSAYLYGASGRECSPSYRAVLKERYPEYSDIISNHSPRYDGLEAYDCTGLIQAFLEASEGEFPAEWRTNVNGSLARWMTPPEPIETMPREPGIILLQQSVGVSSFMHVGVYIGDGLCVHSRGHRHGVVVDPMPQLWTHWARASWLTYDLLEEPAAEEWPAYMGVGDRVLVDTATGGGLNLYKKPIARNRYWSGWRSPNYPERTILEVPEDAPFFRKVTMLSYRGDLYVGYVFAKDLSLIDPLHIEN
jgi:peptidoglycan hydrolase-like protein with peptidoglycan-binding domain